MFQELLNKQSQINPSASYFNIDILKYQVASLPGAASCPFQVGTVRRKWMSHERLSKLSKLGGYWLE
jgi:hypothetical protein